MKGIIPQGKPCTHRLRRFSSASSNQRFDRVSTSRLMAACTIIFLTLADRREALNPSIPHSLNHVRASTVSLRSEMKKNLIRTTFLLLILIVFSSCIGLSMDIQLRKDGSARLTMEYRISNMAEVIGKLDGNENWPIVPVGRADWERTTERVDGARLVSFSSRQNKQDIVTVVTLNFDNTEAMLKFLDSAGKRASLGAGRFELIINEPVSVPINNNLLELVQQVTDGYTFTISFTAEKNSNLTVIDGNGKEIPIPQNAQAVKSGKKVSLSIDIYEIITLADGLGVKFTW